MNNLNKRVKRWLPLILLFGAICAAYAFDLHHGISLESVKEHKEEIQRYGDMHPIIAPLVFMLVYIASVSLSLPIATILTLMGGFMFGLVKGSLMVVTSATIGASVIFVIAGSSLGNALRDKAGSLYKKIEKNMNDNAVGYLLFVRLVPVFPFFLINIVPALFKVPFRVFFLTTFFGIMPASTVFVYFGQQLGEIDNIKDIVSPQMLLAFVLLGVMSLVPTFYNIIKNIGIRKINDTK